MLKYFLGTRLAKLRSKWSHLRDNSSPTAKQPTIFYQLVLSALNDLDSRVRDKNFKFTSKAIYLKFLSQTVASPLLSPFWRAYIGPTLDSDDHWSLVRETFTENYNNDIAWLITLKGIKVRASLRSWRYIDSDKCAYCDRKETIDHCFLNCKRDFSCGRATIPETLCGPDFREYFSFLFSILGPVLSTCREGTPVTCFFIGFLCLAKRLLALFPCSLGLGVPGLGLVFFSRVSPIPFLGLVWLFWVWCHPSHFWARFGFFGCGPLAFLALFPPVFIVCQDFPVSFSCGFGPCVFVQTFSYCFNFRLSFLWRVGPCGQPSGPCFGPFLPFSVRFLLSLFLFPIWCSLARTLVSFMCPRP